MHNFVRVANVVLGAVNVALFLFWLSVIRVESVAPGGAGTFDAEFISLQITILETVVAFVAVVLAVLAFFGYQLVVERAEIKADSTARDVVARLHGDGELSSPGARSRPGGVGAKAANVDTGGAEKEEV